MTSAARTPPFWREVKTLVVRLTNENPAWGYHRIQGAICNTGHKVAPCTIAAILYRHGIEPAPEWNRNRRGKSLLRDTGN